MPKLSGPEALAPLGAGVADPRLGVVHLEDVVRGEVREELSEEKEGEGVHRAQGRRLDQGPARAVVSRSPSPFLSGTLGSGNWFVCLFSNSDALVPCRYPGHIAKAERLLKERLKAVDVILELRDARIAFSTEHPDVSERPTVLCCQVN